MSDDAKSIEPPHAIILAHQRSGTHFLQASLSSHPQIQPRGEFILRYKRGYRNGLAEGGPPEWKWTLRNREGYLNIGIVMYSQVELFESVSGQLDDAMVIHLLRDSKQVAASIAQMQADKAAYGIRFRAHYKLGEQPHTPAPILPSETETIENKVRRLQSAFGERLQHHRRCFTISYEQLTANRQVNAIDPEISATMLRFLGLSDFPLTNDLRKMAAVPEKP